MGIFDKMATKGSKGPWDVIDLRVRQEPKFGQTERLVNFALLTFGTKGGLKADAYNV